MQSDVAAAALPHWKKGILQRILSFVKKIFHKSWTHSHFLCDSVAGLNYYYYKCTINVKRFKYA